LPVLLRDTAGWSRKVADPQSTVIEHLLQFILRISWKMQLRNPPFMDAFRSPLIHRPGTNRRVIHVKSVPRCH